MATWKRWRRVSWAACVLLLAVSATDASAEPAPVEVCWKPPHLPPDVDTFLIVKEMDKWELSNPRRFWNIATSRIVYKYNPSLGADSLDRLPENIRKEARHCVPAPPKAPDPPAADPPPPPPPPPPPKPPPPKKPEPKAPQKGSEKVKGGGSGKKDGPKPLPKASARSSQGPNAMAERPKKKAPSILPPPSAILPRSEHVLPKAKEAKVLPRAEDAKVLPKAEEAKVLPKAEEAPPLPRSSFDHFAANCQAEKTRCKRKTGGEKGPVDERTAFEEVLKEFALFAGAVNLQLDEDLNRPDGKKHGVVGGRNANGPDMALTQAIATFLQLTPAMQGQIKAFINKVNKSVAKKTPVVVETKELSDDAAKWLASQPGSAQRLKDAGTIGPYRTLKEFTLGHEGEIEVHHILEQRWFKGDKKLFSGDTDLVPSVILDKAEHRRITTELNAWIRKNKPKTPEDLWKIYKAVYNDRPHWLDAIKPYFGK
ncbi:MAG: hypothetical protein IPM54_29525 [Polyangiaceae bacterium]|nr:hypothetical protein [Polyangiaceae bacterium]